MKTIPCLFSLMLLLNYSIAQKASFGITAGATFASYKVSIESVSMTSDMHVGFAAGVVASLPMGKQFSFRPQLNYVQKGGNTSDGGASDKLTLNYIELPLNFVYNMPTSSGMFYFGAGPSLSTGVSGKDKWDDGYESGKDDIKFGGSVDDDLKSFEAAINILAGYQFSGGFFVSANYNAGLTNLAQDDEFDSKYHNRYFGVGLGYMFGSKPKPKPQSVQ